MFLSPPRERSSSFWISFDDWFLVIWCWSISSLLSGDWFSLICCSLLQLLYVSRWRFLSPVTSSPVTSESVLESSLWSASFSWGLTWLSFICVSMLLSFSYSYWRLKSQLGSKRGNSAEKKASTGSKKTPKPMSIWSHVFWTRCSQWSRELFCSVKFFKLQQTCCSLVESIMCSVHTQSAGTALNKRLSELTFVNLPNRVFPTTLFWQVAFSWARHPCGWSRKGTLRYLTWYSKRPSEWMI